MNQAEGMNHLYRRPRLKTVFTRSAASNSAVPCKGRSDPLPAAQQAVTDRRIEFARQCPPIEKPCKMCVNPFNHAAEVVRGT